MLKQKTIAITGIWTISILSVILIYNVYPFFVKERWEEGTTITGPELSKEISREWKGLEYIEKVYIVVDEKRFIVETKHHYFDRLILMLLPLLSSFFATLILKEEKNDITKNSH